MTLRALPLLTTLFLAPAVAVYGQNLQPRIDELASGMDDFAPSVEELPLDQITDDFGDPDAVVQDDTPNAPDDAIAAQPAPEQPKATVAIIPEGWTPYSLHGLNFAAPADWQRMTKPDDDDDLAVGDFNMKDKRAIGAVVELLNARRIDGFESDMDDVPKMALKDLGVDLTGAESEMTYPDPIIAPDGGRLLRKKFVMRKGDFYIHAELIYNERPNDRGRTAALLITALNNPEAEAVPVIDKLVGSIGLDAAPEPEVQTGVSGLVSYQMPPPQGWRRQFNGSDALNFITSPSLSAGMSIDTGYRARTGWTNDARFENPPQITRGEIFGHAASIKAGLAKDPYLMDGYTPTKGRVTMYLLDKCLADGSTILVSQSGTPKWLESTGFDTLMASMRLVLPQDAIDCPKPRSEQAAPQAKTASGWTRYANRRFGTSVAYPSSHFTATDTAPANGDGQTFTSDDGAEMRVWGGYNALAQTPQQMMDDVLASHSGAAVLAQEVTAEGFTLTLQTGGQILQQRTKIGKEDVLHNVRVTYPADNESDHARVADKIVQSLGLTVFKEPKAAQTAPATDMDQAFWASIQGSTQVAGFEAYLEQFPNGAHAEAAREQIAALTAPAPKADPNIELTFWQSIQNADDPAMFQAYLDRWPDGTFAVLARLNLQRLNSPVAAPQVQTAPKPAPVIQPAPPARSYYTPARNTAERKALMNTARVPMLRELRQKVIFLVKELRTDGEWYFLMAEPLQPDGTKLDWRTTPYASDWANDAMSDLVMVLMRRQGNNWQVIDYVIGPTDVHWVNWVTRYNLPERLFHAR